MFEYVKAWLALKTDNRAVTALEYGLIAAGIAVVIVGGVASIGTKLQATFAAIAGSL